jgi:hypothetical protein
MSSTVMIDSVRRSEIRFPSDLSRGAVQYVRSSRIEPDYLACRVHLKRVKVPTRAMIETIVRMHRVSYAERA